MKVLVISANAFSKTSNNGKTLEAMFGAFNKEELAMLFFRPIGGNSYDYSYASSYYHVSDMDIVHSVTHLNKRCGGELSDQIANTGTQKQNAKIYSRIKHPMRSSRVLVRDLLWRKFPRWKKGGLLEWAKKQAPDIIFAYLAGGRYMYDVLGFLHKELGVPYVCFYGDDYILYAERKTILDKLLYRRQKKYYSKAISNASARFCIGELMAKDYSSFFGYTFMPIMNSVPLIDYSPKTNNGDSKIVLSYLGGLHLNRWKMLSKIARALPENAVLNIYSGTGLTDEMKNALKGDNIVIHSLIPSEQVLSVMLASDILIHVESDDEEYRRYTRLSVSTKIPEYLISGRMVVGFGPTEVASMRLISDNDLGIIISSDLDVDGVAIILNKICNDADLRRRYGEKGHNYARKNYNKEEIITTFRKQLENIISSNQ